LNATLSCPRPKRELLGFSRAKGQRPRVIGHRDLVRPGIIENTMAAFEAAAEENADGLELDIRMCASGELCVAHDPTLTRVSSGGDRRALADLSRAELERVELSVGVRIPTLTEVLAFARARRMPVNIEMKRDVPNRTAVVRALARVLVTWDPTHPVLVSSFDPFMLGGLRVLAPRIPSALLVHRSSFRRIATSMVGPIGAVAVHLDRTLTRPELVPAPSLFEACAAAGSSSMFGR
jgi:glycerophosphoryl diester phosphodiesterase